MTTHPENRFVVPHWFQLEEFTTCLIPCPHCKNFNTYHSNLRFNEGDKLSCWRCERPITLGKEQKDVKKSPYVQSEDS